MRALLSWVFVSLGVGTVVALIRMAVYAYLYRRLRRYFRPRKRDSSSGSGVGA